MIETGLRFSTELKIGRDAQSSAFLRTPGTPWLYSGVTIRTPSLSAIAALIACTAAGFSSPSRDLRCREESRSSLPEK